MLRKLKRFFKPNLLHRRIRFFIQRRIRGWDDSDTWSLDCTICEIIAPRLRQFKELNNGVPYGLTESQWDAYLDRMIYAAELYAKNGSWTYGMSKKDMAALRRGKNLFIKYFEGLWW